MDGETAYYVEAVRGVEVFLDGLRTSLKDRSFCPVPVRERMIPKSNGKLRRLGIATVTDRVVQASLKLVLEPIFETDFLPCSYGFRPNRRVHDAVAEVRYLASNSYEWVVEGDIKACFDEISHSALMERVRVRIGDKRVLSLVKAFLKSGILGEDRQLRETSAGTPQGSILSPLLSNVALSALDEYITRAPGGHNDCRNDRVKRRRRGLPNFRLIRYADDWCLMVSGSRSDAEALKNEIADVLSTMGLRLSEEKTLITHIEEGLDFLGWHIQRHRKRGANRHYVYTYPSRKAVQAAMAKVKEQCRKTGTNPALDALLIPINWMLRGWCAFFRPGVSSTAFHYLSHFARDRVIRWLRKKHPRTPWRNCDAATAAVDGGQLARPRSCSTRRECTRRATATEEQSSRRLGHWPDEESQGTQGDLWSARCVERRTAGAGSGPEKRAGRKTGTALRSDFTRNAGMPIGMFRR